MQKDKKAGLAFAHTNTQTQHNAGPFLWRMTLENRRTLKRCEKVEAQLRFKSGRICIRSLFAQVKLKIGGLQRILSGHVQVIQFISIDFEELFSFLENSYNQPQRHIVKNPS